MEEKNLEKLKKDYSNLQKKYDLPTFEELNKDFSIEKIAENETDILIREVMRHVADRLANYMRFIESLLNPVNVPMFFYSFAESLDVNQKKKLQSIYEKLVENEFVFLKVDLESSDEGHAGFIKKSYKLWQGIKKDFLNILDFIGKKRDKKSEKSNKSYFG